MVMLQKNILATFCSSDELVVVTASCIVSKFLQQNLQFYGSTTGISASRRSIR